MSEDRFCALPSGIRLCYRVDGAENATTLVLIGGVGFDLVSWPRELIGAFVDKGLRVVRFDNRDCGRSSTMDAPAPHVVRLASGRYRGGTYDLSDMARDTVGLLDHLEIEQAHIAGMSMGGMIAQTVAAEHPQRVRSLSSIFSSTGLAKVGQPGVKTKLLIARPPASAPHARVEQQLALLRHIGSRTFLFDDIEERERIIESTARLEGEDATPRMLRQVGAIQKSGDRTASLRSVLAPTLVIHGNQDQMVHPSGGVATKHAITGARLHVISGMGHGFPKETIDDVVGLIVGHINAAEASSRV